MKGVWDDRMDEHGLTNDATHGLIPPVPIAISASPTMAPAGEGGSPVSPGIAVADITAVPAQYTTDRIKIVLNLPRLESASIPPNSGVM